MTKIDPTPLIAEAQARETALRTKLQAMHRRAQKAEGERDKAKRWAEMLERALQFRRQLNQSTDTALRVALGKIDDAERGARVAQRIGAAIIVGTILWAVVSAVVLA